MFSITKNLYRAICKNTDVFQYAKIKASKSTLTATKTSTTCVKKTYGQPSYESHPNLIKYGEIMPCVQVSEYQNRRELLAESIITYTEQLKKNIKKHLIIIPSATKKYMSDKIPYVFRQNSDFLYLTGCLEPDSCLVVTTDSTTKDVSSILFMREKDRHSETWDGPRTGPDQANSFFGVDKSLPTTDLSKFLTSFLKTKDSMLWFDFPGSIQTTSCVKSVMEDCIKSGLGTVWETPIPLCHKLRLYKSKAEIQLMQKTCTIASEAIIETMRDSKPNVNEHDLYAMVDYECRIRGANYLAYPPVVAGGERANIIHYINNNQLVKDGELVLMDAGCEYFGYSSDITRTWPVNGEFTAQQREIYEIVLDVQKELIRSCGNFHPLDTLYNLMISKLAKYLQEIGLISKSISGQNLMKSAYEFCPHHVSHYLGMDVHDTPTVPRSINIKPGMIITVEPGIYINNRLNVPKEYEGIGIRIEDDVLITEEGPIVLTKDCPKEIEDIEKIVNESI